MNCPEDAVEFVTDWWELNGNIVTTLAALRRLKEAYPADYLRTLCHPHEIAGGAAALQEICQYLEGVARTTTAMNPPAQSRKIEGRRG